MRRNFASRLATASWALLVIFTLGATSGCRAFVGNATVSTNTANSTRPTPSPSVAVNTFRSAATLPQPASSAPSPSPSAKSGAEDPGVGSAVVKSVRANVREYPNTSSAVVEEVHQGERLALTSRSPVGGWYKVKRIQTGSTGWINGNGIVIPDAAAPVAAATPTPTPAPTATPKPAAPATQGSAGDDYYTNSVGNRVHRPVFTNSAPAGASARCRDGSYSFSQHRQGTCSHHGGVAEWL